MSLADAVGGAPPPWFDPLFKRWLDAGERNTRPHAILLTGPAGIGKAMLAQALVAQGLCEHPQPAACGRCHSCHTLAQGTHPDHFLLTREFDEQSGRHKRDISVDRVRQLIERLHLSAHFQRGRFAVIDPVEALNTASANALLKTLEEPAAGTHLLLISDRPQSVLATLRSRCAIWQCPPPDADSAIAWLTAQGVDAGPLSWALSTPMHIRDWAAAERLSVFARWEDGWKAVANGQRPPLAILGDIDKDDIPLFLDWLTRWVHRSMVRAAADDQPGRITALDTLFGELMLAPGRLARNVNATLVVESLALGWWRATAPLRRG